MFGPYATAIDVGKAHRQVRDDAGQAGGIREEETA